MPPVQQDPFLQVSDEKLLYPDSLLALMNTVLEALCVSCEDHPYPIPDHGLQHFLCGFGIA